MNERRARALVVALNAAFPTPAMSDATFALYVTEVARLADEQAAQEAIHGLVRTSVWLPKIAEVHEAYQAKTRAYAQRRADEEHERAMEFALTHGLPRASWEREAIPAETVEWLRARGIDVDGLLRHTEDIT